MLLEGMMLAPVHAGSKVPIGSYKTNARLYDPENPPKGNYGIVLDGQYMVIDFDKDHPERSLIEASLPPTWSQRTGGSKAIGMHYLYTVPKGYQGSNSKLRTSDGTIIGDIKFKGIILGPGSVTESRYYMIDEIVPTPMPREFLISKYVIPFEISPNIPAGTSRITEGGRNDALTSLAGQYRRLGASPAELEAMLLVSNQERCEPPLPAQEVALIAKSAKNWTPEQRLSLVPGDRITVGGNFNLPILSWYIHGFILKGGYLMTGYAPGGTGKSSFGHFLAACVTQEGDNFLVISHEDPPEYWKDCAIVSGADETKLYSHNNPLSLRVPNCIEELENIITEWNIKFIWFDSIKDHMPRGGKGDAQEQARDGLIPLADLAVRTGCAMFGVFHTNKKGLPGGSTSFLDVSRLTTEFKREKNAPLYVRVEKGNIMLPDHALKMIGELKVLRNPKNDKEVLMESLEDGTTQPRKTWITTSYVKDSKVLEKMEKDKEQNILKDEVYRLRFEEGLTQSAIGKLKGISQSTVYRLLSEQKEHISQDELN